MAVGWPPGTRVTWESTTYGRLTGTVAAVAPLAPVDRRHAPGVRIPIDLDTPFEVTIAVGTPGKRVTRLYVRDEFLERLEEVG